LKPRNATGERKDYFFSFSILTINQASIKAGMIEAHHSRALAINSIDVSSTIKYRLLNFFQSYSLTIEK